MLTDSLPDDVRALLEYVGGPYPRGEDRVVFLIEAERAAAQSFG